LRANPVHCVPAPAFKPGELRWFGIIALIVESYGYTGLPGGICLSSFQSSVPPFGRPYKLQSSKLYYLPPPYN
jgi:hypothetical protein